MEVIDNVNKKPSEELTRLIIAAAHDVVSLGTLRDQIFKMGSDEGFTDKEIKELVRAEIKKAQISLTKHQMYYLLNKEKRQLESKDYKDKNLNTTSAKKVASVATLPEAETVSEKEDDEELEKEGGGGMPFDEREDDYVKLPKLPEGFRYVPAEIPDLEKAIKANPQNAFLKNIKDLQATTLDLPVDLDVFQRAFRDVKKEVTSIIVYHSEGNIHKVRTLAKWATPTPPTTTR